jgi:hypothetical protein
MRKLILEWLFGTSDIAEYMDLLKESLGYAQKYLDLCNDSLKILESHKEDLDILRKLIKICDNHGIDIDEEIKLIQLED